MQNARNEHLTSVEKEKLNQVILGYGKLTEAAEKTGLHLNTIRQISYKGHGAPDTIRILREKLLIEDNAEVKTA